MGVWCATNSDGISVASSSGVNWLLIGSPPFVLSFRCVPCLRGCKQANMRGRLRNRLRSRGAARQSVQTEALGADELSEACAQGLGILPRLVLGPAVGSGMAPSFRSALARIGAHGLATAIISFDPGILLAVPVAVLVQGHFQTEPGCDVPSLCRPARAKPGHGDHA